TSWRPGEAGPPTKISFVCARMIFGNPMVATAQAAPPNNACRRVNTEVSDMKPSFSMREARREGHRKVHATGQNAGSTQDGPERAHETAAATGVSGAG